MSQSPSASTSSSNFQSIFYAALKAYEKKTKKDLLAHPLSAQLQACKSPGDILVVLQDKVNEFESIKDCRRTVIAMAESDYQCPLCILGDTRRRCWTCGSYPLNLSTPLNISVTGILPRTSDLRRCWRPSFGEPQCLEAIPTLKTVTGSQGC
jgi:hypothetical protein